MMKKITILFTATLIGACLVGCGNEKQVEDLTNNNTQVENDVQTDEEEATMPAKTEGNNPKVAIDVENYGVITVELDADSAPISVENFLKLTNEGFYDGLTFHRIIDGFMMQGGDPTGTGMGGANENIKGEFASNGVDNKLSHTKGAISMARSGDPNSASSQFFIVDEDSVFLDGDYAAFGYVTEGMDIVNKICDEAKVADGNGTVLPDNQPIIKSIKVV